LAKISRNINKVINEFLSIKVFFTLALKIADLGFMCTAIARFQEERGNMFELENDFADD